MTSRRSSARVVTVLVAALVGGGATWVGLGGPGGSSAVPPAEQAPLTTSAQALALPRAAPRPGARTGPLPGRRLRPLADRERDGDRDRREQVAAPPRSLALAAVDLAMPVRPVGVDDDGLLVVPGDATVAGWYRDGPAPGERGATVVVGHVDTDGGLGPMAALPAADPGDRVVVGTADGPERYRVLRVSRVPKADLDLAGLFARDGRPRLHLVTCGGPFDPEDGYRDNVVVVAVPERGGPR